MRNYIYKTLIAVIALIVVFEFTIGRTLNKVIKQSEIILTKEGRKDLVNSIKEEMEKADKRENNLNYKVRKTSIRSNNIIL